MSRNRRTGAYTTRTTDLDVFDKKNLYRKPALDRTLHMHNKNDGTFLKMLDVWGVGEPVEQPYYRWIEDDILDIATEITAVAGNASDTSIEVAEGALAFANTEVYCVRTGENMLVTGVSGNTWTVSRGFMGSAKQALKVGDKLIALPAHLAEMASANSGTIVTPSGEKYNNITRFSESFKISHIQQNAAMFETSEGEWAKIPWETARRYFELMRKINKALLFSKRGTNTSIDADNNTIYSTQGFVNYIEDNVLDLGETNQNLSWPVLSAWLDDMFDPTASSSEKVLMAGSNLFGGIQRMARDMGTPPVKYYIPDINADMYEIHTESGNTVMVTKDKKGMPPEEGLSGFGIVVDLQHVKKRELAGEPIEWRPEIQNPNDHIRQDEIWGSYSLQLMHPDCHGVIRDAATGIIS